MTRLSAPALAGAIVLAAASATVAAADPRVDLERCSALDHAALRRAVDAELAGITDEKLTAVGDRTVIVDCPDAVTAHLQLDPPPATGPIARSLDLGEVPSELRPRLVALAVVEVIEVAALIGTGAAPTTGPNEPSTPTTPPPADKTSGIDPTPLGNGNGGPGAPGRVAAAATTPTGFAAGGISDGPIDTIAERRVAVRRALGDGRGILRGRAVTPRIGVRIYTASATPMLDAGVDLAFGALAIGVAGAIGQTDDPLGTVRPYLLTATGGVTLACARNGGFEACAAGRAAAGLAGVSATATDPGIAAHGTVAPYLELGGQLELGWRGRGYAVVVAVDAGWAEGLVALAGMRAAARLDGTVLATTLGVRW